MAKKRRGRLGSFSAKKLWCRTSNLCGENEETRKIVTSIEDFGEEVPWCSNLWTG